MNRKIKHGWQLLRAHVTNLRYLLRLRGEWLAYRAPASRRDGRTPVISLTSYPPRFATLHLTLQSLLMQSCGGRVVLWIADADIGRLPQRVRVLERSGLEIRTCDDIRSYKKLVPMLRLEPGATIVTADDDIYYWPTWLQELMDARVAGVDEVVCHRMHHMRLGADGLPLPYAQWEHDSSNSEPDVLNFPTGIGGVLYPAGIFDPRVLDAAQFMTLCPRGDDIWFYWMARSRGARFRRTARPRYFHCWQGTQEVGLWQDNLGANLNDVQIRAMIGALGFFARTTK